MKEIYDSLYLVAEEYTTKMLEFEFFPEKIQVVTDVLSGRHVSTIIDVGCGQGHYSRYLISKGYDVTGIELSDVCCKKFLFDVKHICMSVVDYVEQHNDRFDFVLCTDVLEHLHVSDIPSVLKGFSNMSDVALLGIANHSSVVDGNELHLIQKPAEWWTEQLNPYFRKTSVCMNIKDGLFFFILAEK